MVLQDHHWLESATAPHPCRRAPLGNGYRGEWTCPEQGPRYKDLMANPYGKLRSYHIISIYNMYNIYIYIYIHICIYIYIRIYHYIMVHKCITGNPYQYIIWYINVYPISLGYDMFSTSEKIKPGALAGYCQTRNR